MLINTTENSFDQIDSLLLLAKICHKNEAKNVETSSVISKFWTLVDGLGLRSEVQKTLESQGSNTGNPNEAISFLDFMADNHIT